MALLANAYQHEQIRLENGHLKCHLTQLFSNHGCFIRYLYSSDAHTANLIRDAWKQERENQLGKPGFVR